MTISKMRQPLIIVLLLLLCGFAAAQNASPHGELSDQQPRRISSVITFTFDFPQGTPPFYSIAIESTGRAEYKSTPKTDNVGDPYSLKFVTSDATCNRLFDLARQLNFFNGSFDYKHKVAFTGTKTLSFKSAQEEHQASYNWSESPQIQEITNLFQSMEETFELGRQLEDKYRFDKLGVDAVLKVLEQDAKENRLAEIQAIQPILTRIAKDTGMMNISRRRAEFLLTKVPKGAVITSESGEQ